MAIITKSRLDDLTDSFSLRSKTFSMVLNEARSENRTTATTSIFLSHSHSDLENEYVKKTIALLRGLGLRIYIDSDDSSMPPFTNAETACRIKQEIKSNRKFILLATNAAISSKWCNWELGLGNAHKFIEHISLFPLADNSTGWNGNEYLKIYPRIEEIGIRKYHVIYPSGSSVPIEQWLRN